MQKIELPLVSVPVVTYNSAKTILETLESIKAQTYPNVELIISDDCSTDNTVELCREWVAQNKERFARTEIITVAKNTGVSGNNNRAANACKGEWIKSVAGDDVFMPTCIQDYINYITEHPETIYTFGRCKAFGVDESYCSEIDRWFDYSFFALTPEEQIHRLLFEGNCVPGTTVFYHRQKAKEVGVKEDERIPLLEDWPKWINLLRAGVKFHFIDKVLVKYRVGGVSTLPRLNPNLYRSQRMFSMLYQYPEWYKADPEKAAERVVADEMEIYEYLMDINQRLRQLEASKAYRLGKALLKPFGWMKKK